LSDVIDSGHDSAEPRPPRMRRSWLAGLTAALLAGTLIGGIGTIATRPGGARIQPSFAASGDAPAPRAGAAAGTVVVPTPAGHVAHHVAAKPTPARPVVRTRSASLGASFLDPGADWEVMPDSQVGTGRFSAARAQRIVGGSASRAAAYLQRVGYREGWDRMWMFVLGDGLLVTELRSFATADGAQASADNLFRAKLRAGGKAFATGIPATLGVTIKHGTHYESSVMMHRGRRWALVALMLPNPPNPSSHHATLLALARKQYALL
jgi:hypothetical protein